MLRVTLGCLFFLILNPLHIRLCADASESVAAYSDFKSIDLTSLKNGEILTQRNTPTSSSRTLAVQSCFLVKKPLQETASLLIDWNPQSHADLNIYTLTNFKPKDDPLFGTLAFDPNIRPIKLLLEATAKAREKSADLDLTPDELQLLRQQLGSIRQEIVSPEFRKAASSFWSSILTQRLQLFLTKGIHGIPDSNTGEKHLSMAEEVRSFFDADPRICSEFSELSKEILNTPTPNPTLCYWQLFKADNEAALSLGALFSKSSEAKIQIADLQFYVNTSYYTSITLYQLHPVQVDSQPQTLIWRADYVSAPAFSRLRGIEKLAAGMLMLKDTTKAIGLFQQDAMK